MASAGPGLNASQFYVTLSDSLDSLDERHTVFGAVSEGLDVLEALNEVPVDNAGRPLQNIRIRHAIILEDPFEDPPQLGELIPDASPPPTFEHGDRLEEDWVPEHDDRPPDEVEKEARAAETKSRAVVLEMIGDLPEADVRPPSNMLFVCKLNPVTTEEDLEIIFSRFGNVTSCDIIRDYKTGDSLCYAFIGYDSDQSCEAAYFKMNNVLIDDRRIKVDFSQSVSHIWRQFKRHGKKGGTADMAVEAAGHERSSVGGRGGGQGSRGGRFEQRGGGGDRGLLLGDPEELPPRQQQQQREYGSRGPDRPAAAGNSSKRSRSRSRSRSQRRGRSASSSRSRDGSRKHKKEKHKKHKNEKHTSRDRSRSPEAIAADGRGPSRQESYGRDSHHREQHAREPQQQYRGHDETQRDRYRNEQHREQYSRDRGRDYNGEYSRRDDRYRGEPRSSRDDRTRRSKEDRDDRYDRDRGRYQDRGRERYDDRRR
eukprot:GHUV01005434.1.p1 GENE.GHUV01005434.1~~GHUV01005434.1.p1  ORF type:complete len:492 (+),score=89.17 GHUV01005434.1:32-1477(+)